MLDAAIYDAINNAELATVAACALDAPQVQLIGQVSSVPIVSPHNEPRTVAILRCSGLAMLEKQERPWSAVAKIVDFRIPPGPTTAWTHAENEERVYQSGAFVRPQQGFRSAACYCVLHPVPGVTVMWIEDLSDARHAPFTLPELAEICEHLGEWNGYWSHQPAPPNLSIGRDSILARWRNWPLDQEVQNFRSMAEHPFVRQVYEKVPIGTVFSLADLFRRLLNRSAPLTRSLCFGDCNIGNLFHRPGSTIAVDWASLTEDPSGVDAGCLVGSAATWGRDLAEVVRRERELFGHYCRGSAGGGWKGDPKDLRMGFLLHFGFYLLQLAMLPASLTKYPRERVEMRMGAKWEDLPRLVAPVAELLPSYENEIEGLLV